MKIKAFLSAGVLLTLAVVGFGAAGADEKPDFSGKWKMDARQSDFGAFPGPDAQTNVIEHKDPKLKVATSSKGGPRGDLSYERNYTTDGKESVNTQNGQEIKTVCTWDGKTIVLKSKTSFQGNDIAINETYALAEGGKSMTITREIKGAFGELTQKVLFTKEE